MPLQKYIPVAQQVADGLNKKNAEGVPAQLAQIIQEREKRIEDLFQELGKSKREIGELEDLISYQRDRIAALEGENKSISLELKKKIEECNKISALRDSAKTPSKRTAKSRSYKKPNKNSALRRSAKDPEKSVPKPVTYEIPKIKLDI